MGHKISEFKQDVLAGSRLKVSVAIGTSQVVRRQQHYSEADIRVSLHFLDYCSTLIRLFVQNYGFKSDVAKKASDCFSSLTIVSPGDTKVVQFFGRYIGTIRKAGLLMTVPFTTKKKVSVKVRNFETNELKVNDADGNPVNIAAIVVWQVADTAKSVFAVEKYDEFVAVQSESALRHVATTHPYDNGEAGEETLRGSTELVAQELADEVAARISIAGLEVVETRISSLAYAPEIAQAMLQRQQASAIIAAREKIVEGAVTMVQRALERLESDNVVTLDDERKASMVSNLLVVLTSESRVTPVVNAGSLYT